MKTLLSGMQTHIGETVTSLTSIYRLTRRDGEEFYFTDHDASITYDDGDGSAVYLPSNSYERSAIASSASLSVDNLDMVALFSTAQITEQDLRAGLFDYAEIRVSFVNWKDVTTDGNIKMRRGRLGEVMSTNTGTFHAELRGMTQMLIETIVENYAPECRADLGDPQCTIPIRPDILGRTAAVVLGEFYRVVTLASTNITYPGLMLNESFERGTTGNGQVPTDWTGTGVWDLETGTVDGLAADNGSNFLRGGSASGTMTQTQSLLNLGITQASIDASDLTMDFSIRRANTDVDDTGQVVVNYLDVDGTIISTAYDSTDEEITPADTWVTRSVTSNAVPVNTVSVQVILSHTLVTGIQSDSCFDNISMSFTDSGSTNAFQEVYENRIYEVTTAGTTSGSQPTYDTVIDNTTTDGTAVLTARDSWTRDGHVVDVIDTLNINISVTDVRAVDEWYNGGVIVFDAGDNSAVALEIRDWTETGGYLRVFMEMPFSPIPGTPVHVYPGCDKRIATCLARFANVINFQAEPYVPDADSQGVENND